MLVVAVVVLFAGVACKSKGQKSRINQAGMERQEEEKHAKGNSTCELGTKCFWLARLIRAVIPPSSIVVAVPILSEFATVLLSSNLPPTEFMRNLVKSLCLDVRQHRGIELVGFSDVLFLYVLHLWHLMGAICAFSFFLLSCSTQQNTFDATC